MIEADPRNIALDILLATERDGTFLDPSPDGFPELPRRESSFVTRLVKGTVERRIEIDYILDQFSDIKVKKMKPVIREVLRSGVYQLMYMDRVPDAAACSEAVKLAKRRGFSGLSGFVNGVMRNIARHRGEIVYPSPKEDPVRALSVRYSMPEWITERFLGEYGEERCARILAAYLKERPLCVRADPRVESLDELRASLESQGVRVKSDKRFPRALFLVGFDSLKGIPEFAAGTVYVQDPAQTAAVDLAAPRPGELVVDVCAAPGGKSIMAAQMMYERGQSKGLVIARDISEAKAALIRENKERCRVSNLRAEVRDARAFDPELKEMADLVIADLPCSGLGVIGRKPDIKYRVKPEDIGELSALQREILSVVRGYVKPGGRLLYSTCTLTEEENRGNVDRFLDDFPEFSLQKEKGYLPDEGCDGFYAAILKKDER